MKQAAPILIFFLSVYLEGTFTTIPFCLASLLIFYILYRHEALFFIAFFCGIFLDVFLLRGFGTTSIFFILYLGIIGLYERKFEIQSYQFVIFASFLGGLLYSIIFIHSFVILHTISTIVIAILLFLLIKTLYKEEFVKHSNLFFEK